MEQSSIPPPHAVGTAPAVFLSAWHIPSPSTSKTGREKFQRAGSGPHHGPAPCLGCSLCQRPVLAVGEGQRHGQGALQEGLWAAGVAHTYLVALGAVLTTVLTTPLYQNHPWLKSRQLALPAASCTFPLTDCDVRDRLQHTWLHVGPRRSDSKTGNKPTTYCQTLSRKIYPPPLFLYPLHLEISWKAGPSSSYQHFSALPVPTTIASTQ